MATNAEWATGYARQADADFLMFQLLSRDVTARECHKLQFLQMACEKLVKSHLCGAGQAAAAMQTSHAFVAAHLSVVLRQQAVFLNFTGKRARTVLRHASALAREIDVLAPAVKRGGQRPDNCEYPWEDSSGALHVPLDWTFQPSRLIVPPYGPTVLKLIRGAIDRLLP